VFQHRLVDPAGERDNHLCGYLFLVPRHACVLLPDIRHGSGRAPRAHRRPPLEAEAHAALEGRLEAVSTRNATSTSRPANRQGGFQLAGRENGRWP
jgi:hypothetical protein